MMFRNTFTTKTLDTHSLISLVKDRHCDLQHFQGLKQLAQTAIAHLLGESRKEISGGGRSPSRAK